MTGFTWDTDTAPSPIALRPTLRQTVLSFLRWPLDWFRDFFGPFDFEITEERPVVKGQCDVCGVVPLVDDHCPAAHWRLHRIFRRIA